MAEFVLIPVISAVTVAASGPAVIPAFGQSGFPITLIAVPETVVAAVNATAAGKPRDTAATEKMLLPAMQQLFQQPGFVIDIDPKDITLKKTFPDTQVDSNCHHKIEAEHPTAIVTTRNGTNLRWGVTNISWHNATVFAEARVVSLLDVNTDVCVRVGQSLFHHCEQIARKTVGIDIESDGDIGVGFNVTAFDAHLEWINHTLCLVFDLHATVVGTVLEWNVQKVTANNCKIKILGIEIASVCGLVEKYVKQGASQLTNHVMSITAPSLLQKLQEKINTLLGSRVTIPLKVMSSWSGAV